MAVYLWPSQDNVTGHVTGNVVDEGWWTYLVGLLYGGGRSAFVYTGFDLVGSGTSWAVRAGWACMGGWIIYMDTNYVLTDVPNPGSSYIWLRFNMVTPSWPSVKTEAVDTASIVTLHTDNTQFPYAYCFRLGSVINGILRDARPTLQNTVYAYDWNGVLLP